MKKFNLEEALNDKPVVTRDGKKIEELYLFKNRKSMYCLACLIEDNDNIETFTKEGEYIKGETNILDLFMADEFYGFKDGYAYYILCSDGEIETSLYHTAKGYLNDDIQNGNVFRTKEEAEKEREYRQARFRLNAKMRELEGGWKADWNNTEQRKYTFNFDCDNQKISYSFMYKTKSNESWRYSNEETIEWVVKNMQDDIKTVLDIK